MRTEKNLAKVVQCMKWAAALAVARSLEVRDLLERGEKRPIHERIQLALQPVLPDHSCVLVLVALEGTLRFAVARGPEADAETAATIAAVQRLLHAHLGQPGEVH